MVTGETEMMGYFEKLGNKIEEAWRKKSYDEVLFPRLAEKVLAEDPPSEAVEISEILDWIFTSSGSPSQPVQSTLFGEPPLLLFSAPRFYIEALFWFSGTTEIHEHGFSGAFSVLSGSSVHSHWTFDKRRVVNSRMICGDIRRDSTEILRPGGIRRIYPGDQLIHQLFHLEVPSVTIVVRTYQDKNHLPQYKCLLPGLAIDPFDRDPLRERRLLLLRSMRRGQLDGLQEYMEKLIQESDLETIFYAFSEISRGNSDLEILGQLYEKAETKHGEIIKLFKDVCEEQRRVRIITARRAKVSDPEARFLLALLMLQEDREAIFQTIELEYPGRDPGALVEEWVERMSDKETIGFEFEGPNKIIFRELMMGSGSDEILTALKKEYRDDAIRRQAESLRAHIETIASSVLFSPLFHGASLDAERRLSLQKAS